jgi:hypothetical protein
VVADDEGDWAVWDWPAVADDCPVWDWLAADD